ncbi:hypothetical protein TNIN_372991 [Trichonephila inaurata madagascariensis]|uniref:Uncharacterized protein n=1 Tax=Trichonephila inaurata madagascariensis TaxID=2747483 RepID=A0A8X6YE93_9ARAC|nr:hypothetical protein TNIN_372991 [Trichonephila inaurata madagascariensis]
MQLVLNNRSSTLCRELSSLFLWVTRDGWRKRSGRGERMERRKKISFRFLDICGRQATFSRKGTFELLTMLIHFSLGGYRVAKKDGRQKVRQTCFIFLNNEVLPKGMKVMYEG